MTPLADIDRGGRRPTAQLLAFDYDFNGSGNDLLPDLIDGLFPEIHGQREASLA